MESNQLIKRLCNIGDETYINKFFDAGVDFLQWYSSNDTMCVDLLKACPSFWKWWKSQWMQREEVFVNLFQNVRNNHSTMRERWHMIHAPESVESYPPKAVMEDSWNVLMSEAWADVSISEHKKVKEVVK